MIEPKFVYPTSATVFRNIIAVVEENNGDISSYYLLKSGERVAEGQVWTSDFRVDCESDNSIRFRDPESGKVGYLSGDGEVLIPALYDAGSPFVNGVASVLTGASRYCWGGVNSSDGCEHWRWRGGEELLIDKGNRVLVRRFDGDSLDRTTMQVTAAPLSDPHITSFLGEDGRYYNLTDQRKAFEGWLVGELIHDLSVQKLAEHAYPTISYYDRSGSGAMPGGAFVRVNYQTLKENLLTVSTGDYFIAVSEVERSLFSDVGDAEKYLDDCGRAHVWRHPVLTIVVEQGDGATAGQNHFAFLKTEEGYRLFDVRLEISDLNDGLHRSQ